MIDTKDTILIGTLARTHGKVGEIQCRTTNDYWDDANADFILLRLDHILVPFRVTDWRYKGEDILFSLKNITTEEQALRLVGAEVYMRREDIQQANDGTILSWQDIVGYTINGCTIVSIDDSTANILAMLQDGRLVPLHEDLITQVDHTSRAITMNLPQGL